MHKAREEFSARHADSEMLNFWPKISKRIASECILAVQNDNERWR